MAQIGSERKVVPTQLDQWKQIVINGLICLYEDGWREIEQVKKQHQIEKEQLYAKTGSLTSEMSGLKRISTEMGRITYPVK